MPAKRKTARKPAKKASAPRRAPASAPRRASAERIRIREAPAAASEEAPPRASQEPPAASPFTPGMAPECLMCPFGLFYFTLRQARPEAMEHLMTAGQELFLAFKAVVDQTAERWEQTQGLQRITVR